MHSELDALSSSQKAAVLHTAGPAVVYAGPGSGKTRVVTMRAAFLVRNSHRALVTTFTREATEEMRSRLSAMLPPGKLDMIQVTTLHALALQILREAGKKFSLLKDDYQCRRFAELASASELEGGITGFLKEISYRKNMGETPETFRPDKSSEERAFAKVWKTYEKRKAEKELREFDDLILDAVKLLESDENVRQDWGMRYDQILVDECQDMNLPQYRIVFSLAKDHKNLMLVGDMDQSLYSFRGADPVTFRKFASHPGSKVFELPYNYRSSSSILTMASALIRQDASRHTLNIAPTRPEGEPVVWHRYSDADDEALGVAAQILEMKKQGNTFAEMAVLYRTNAQSEAFERQFSVLGIPYTLKDEGDFYSRKEMKGILAYLHFFQEAGEYPDEWLAALLNAPNRGLTRGTGMQIANVASLRGCTMYHALGEFYAPDLATHKGIRRLRQELERIEREAESVTSASEAISLIRSVTGYDDWLRRSEQNTDDNDRIQNLDRMQEAASHYTTISEFLKAIDKVREEKERRKSLMKRKKKREEVTLSTGHGAKGLEWDIVFAAGWSEQILPHRKAENIDEERRVAYVMLTRARNILVISSLNSWNLATVSPSRFLTSLRLPPTASPKPQESAYIEPDPAESDPGGLFAL